jgi:hypothetical protein
VVDGDLFDDPGGAGFLDDDGAAGFGDVWGHGCGDSEHLSFV